MTVALEDDPIFALTLQGERDGFARRVAADKQISELMKKAGKMDAKQLMRSGIGKLFS